jgi:hypothetical protein
MGSSRQALLHFHHNWLSSDRAFRQHLLALRDLHLGL